MASRRDDFSKPIVRTSGLRAGYMCSNPDCRRPTASPHSDPSKALITGEAAHICAAAENGPRYDPSQSTDDRKAITNAIWLCGDCNKRIDTDWAAWPATQLHAMKNEHEQWIGAQGMIPKLPEVSLVTLTGLRLHPAFSTITTEELATIREQELTLHNLNRVPLHNVKLTMYLHEPVLMGGKSTHNAGTVIRVIPAETPWTVTSAGAGAVIDPPQNLAQNLILEIQVLSPAESVIIPFYTCDPQYQAETDQPVDCEIDLDSIYTGFRTPFFLEGTYQFLLRGEYVTTEIFVPLRYSYKNRTIASFPSQISREPWEVTPTILFRGVQLQG